MSDIVQQWTTEEQDNRKENGRAHNWKLAYITIDKHWTNYLFIGNICVTVTGTFVRTKEPTRKKERQKAPHPVTHENADSPNKNPNQKPTRIPSSPPSKKQNPSTDSSKPPK